MASTLFSKESYQFSPYTIKDTINRICDFLVCCCLLINQKARQLVVSTIRKLQVFNFIIAEKRSEKRTGVENHMVPKSTSHDSIGDKTGFLDEKYLVKELCMI
jgi:hypothetical protein